MAELVYALCGLTCLVCTVLLLRAYRTSRSRLLLWSAACFIGLTANNLLLFADLVLFPSIDLSLYRTALAAVALATLVVGLVWETT
jgi:hypothetical protein